MYDYVAHSKRNSIFKVKVIRRGQRPKKRLPFRAITVLRKDYFSKSLGNIFILKKIFLKSFFFNKSSRIRSTIKPRVPLPQRHIITAPVFMLLLKYTILFERVHASHMLNSSYKLNKKLCLQKVNVVRKNKSFMYKILFKLYSNFNVKNNTLQSLKKITNVN